MNEHISDYAVTWGGGFFALVMNPEAAFQALAAIGVFLGGVAQLARLIREWKGRPDDRREQRQ